MLNERTSVEVPTEAGSYNILLSKVVIYKYFHK